MRMLLCHLDRRLRVEVLDRLDRSTRVGIERRLPWGPLDLFMGRLRRATGPQSFSLPRAASTPSRC